MCHEDIRTRLSDALNDAFRGTGTWCYVVAVFGDDKSGDVIYSCSSDLKKAAYIISAGSTKIETAAAVDVQPLTTYETETVTTSEAGARHSKRDLSQLQTIHDSAVGLGANCSMAESARGRAALPNGNADNGLKHGAPGQGNPAGGRYNDASGASLDASAVIENALVNRGTSMQLVESAQTLETIVLREARADYEIKLIAPGKGSSAFYPAEVLKRDGPGVFKEGTHVYLNHATPAEEAARPEGDVRNLAGVLSTTAVYSESHAKGPGLYARMKVFADHATLVEEKAAHVGMSIRASGVAESGGQRREGLPVLKQLVAAQSVDVVTQAGAGGMILTEAATAANPNKESEMDEAAVQKLIEAAVKSAQTPLLERAIRGDAREEATRILAGVTLQEASKSRVIDLVLARELPVTDGALDKVKFAEAVNAEAKLEGAYVASLTGAGRVTGMGQSVVVDPAAETRLHEASVRTHKRAFDVFSQFGLPADAAKRIAEGYGEAA